MSSYPLLSRVCAIRGSELLDALQVGEFDEAIQVGNIEVLDELVAELELPCLDGVIELLLRPELRQAMGFASPHALRDIEKYVAGKGRRYRYGARLQRSVMGYATRAGLKPSPFSHFTRLGADADGVSRVIEEEIQLVPTHSLARELEAALPSADERTPGDCAINPTIRLVEGRALGWRAQYLLDGSFAWRADEIVDSTSWLCGPSGIRGALPNEPMDLAMQLLDGTAVLSDCDTQSLDLKVPERCERSPIDPANALGLSADGSPNLPNVYHIVTERREQPDIATSRAHWEIEAWLRQRLRVVSTYSDLAVWASSQFSVGAQVDLAEFLIRAMRKFEETTPKVQMRRPTGTDLENPYISPPMASVFWQHCPSVRRGAIVANNSNGPGLGAALRWGGAIAGQAQSVLRQVGMRNQINFTPFTFGDEWNGIQSGGDASWTWPSGRRRRANDLPLHEFSILVEDGKLAVLRNGRPTVPIYAGAMPEHRITGTARIFALLGHPYAFEMPLKHDLGEQWSRQIEGEVLVTRRAGVVVSASLLDRWRTLPLSRTLLELRSWVDETGIGRGGAFWKAMMDTPSTDPSKRKPAFVDFSSPHLVASFLKSAPKGCSVIVEEALPAVCAESAATEEFVSLVVLDSNSGSQYG